MQTVWKGAISFGLVSIPVRLVGATDEKDVSFRQVHAKDGGRVRYKRICEIDGEEVAYADIAKGYELPDGEMVVLTDKDFKDLPVASNKVVDVVAFVPFDEIDPTSFARAYYAEPTGDAKPYVLLRDTLDEADRVAVVKVSLRNRERLAILRAREGVLILQTLLWPDEVRRPDFGFLNDDVNVRPQEIAMAQSYVETLSGEFEPGDYVDEYRNAIEEVITAKTAGREVEKPKERSTGDGKVVDLMEALRRSVADAKRRRGEAVDDDDEDEAPSRTGGSTKKTAAKKVTSTPVKKAAGKSATVKKTAAKEAAVKTTAKKAAATRVAARKSA